MEIVEEGELLRLEKICQKTIKGLETRLSQLSPQTSHSIYKVPRHLRDVNNKAFEPQIVAIGPYHHGRPELKRTEELKLRYMQSLLQQKREVLVECISATAKELKQARNCYEESSINLNDDEFTDMLVLDGCFIIQVMHDRELFDRTFPVRSSYRILKRDLILLENQIPLFVLCKLFDLIYEPKSPESRSLLLQRVLLFCDVFPGNKFDRFITMRISDDAKHILDLIHIYLCPPNSSDNHTASVPDQGCCASWCCPTTTSSLDDIIPSASELKDANVKFHNKEHNLCTSLFDVEFKKSGKMLMPTLMIDDSDDGTESWLRNLIAYEQLLPFGSPSYFADYIILLDCLINTPKDVQILRRAKIINNFLGSEEAVVELVNKLGECVMLDNFMYKDTFRRINAHHQKRWNRAVAAFHRDYFNSAWAYVAFLGALILFLLTAAQTIFSALQVF